MTRTRCRPTSRWSPGSRSSSAAFRAPYRGRSTPVNAWWGSFDLAVNLFSGRPADPPSTDFIMRNAMDAQEIAVGWWPGDPRYPKAAFYAYAHPAAEGFAGATLSPAAARWAADLGEYVLDWNDVSARVGPTHGGAGVRRVGVPARLRGLPVGPAAGVQRGGVAAAGQLAGTSEHAPATGVEHQVTPDLGRPDRVAPHSPCGRQLLDEAQPVSPESVGVLGDKPGSRSQPGSVTVIRRRWSSSIRSTVTRWSDPTPACRTLLVTSSEMISSASDGNAWGRCRAGETTSRCGRAGEPGRRREPRTRSSGSEARRRPQSAPAPLVAARSIELADSCPRMRHPPVRAVKTLFVLTDQEATADRAPSAYVPRSSCTPPMRSIPSSKARAECNEDSPHRERKPGRPLRRA